ncbi:MAG: amino terminal protease family [Ignavibacteria bacterium]|nr:amino terminal protease family [Ignavibacteria bacterium]
MIISKFIKENFLPVKEFLLNPVDEEDNNSSKSLKLNRFFVVFLIDMLVSALSVVLLASIQSLNLINIDNNKIIDFIRYYPIEYVLILGVLFIPIIEELIFRFSLRINRFYPLQILLFLNRRFPKDESSIFDNKVRFLWNKYYRVIFYSSALLFGLYHLTNYKITVWVLILTPILIFPQFIFGLLAGYLRVRFGFILGLCLHILHNAIFLAIPLILTIGESEVFNVKTKDYTLIISETKYGGRNNSLNTSTELDSLKVVNIEFKELIPFLLDREKQLIEYSDVIKSSITLNLNYTSSIKNRISNRDKILNKLKQLYKFEIETSKQYKERWVLHIIDSLKLSKFTSAKTQSLTSKMTSKNDKIVIDNSNLEDIAKFLGSHFKNFIIPEKSLGKKYNLTFQATDFEIFRKVALEQFGLQFVQSNLKTEITKIRYVR